MHRDPVNALKDAGIPVSAQRVAIADYILNTEEHPSADQVWAKVRARLPMISRATVYNTLHCFAEKGLLRERVLAENRLVFDARIDQHHHFIDETSGAIVDVPWNALKVSHIDSLKGMEVHAYEVVLRGRRVRRP